jgi:hypothetical protein
MDTYAQRQGHYTDAQEKRLAEMRATLAAVLREPAEQGNRAGQGIGARQPIPAADR